MSLTFNYTFKNIIFLGPLFFVDYSWTEPGDLEDTEIDTHGSAFSCLSPEEISLWSSHSLYCSCLFRCLVLWAAVILVPSCPREIPQLSNGAGRIPVGILALSSPVLKHSGCFGTIREHGKAKAKHGTIKNPDYFFPCFRSFVCLNHATKTFCLLCKKYFGF